MNKFIFLDFDGVLNTENYFKEQSELGNLTTDEYGCLFDSKSIGNLEKVIVATNAKIVISSSWRFDGNDKMQELWKNRKLPGIFLDCTPLSGLYENACRGAEIQDWFNQNATPKDRYVIFDDMPDMLRSQESFFIRTNAKIGITEAEKAIAILNG